MPRLKGKPQGLSHQIAIRVTPDGAAALAQVYGNPTKGASTAARQWLALRDLELEHLREIFTDTQMQAIKVIWKRNRATVDAEPVIAELRRRAGTYPIENMCAELEKLSPCSVYFLTEWCVLPDYPLAESSD